MRRINVARRELVPAMFGWPGDRALGNGLSGAQSTLAGIFFVRLRAVRPITNVVPYAAFGAFYFLVSAVWLTVGDARCPGCWLKVKLALV